MLSSRRLILAHFWLAFVVFGVALVLGAWQMFVRSPLNPWSISPELYYRSVTAHGSAMAYVFPTLIAMGFGYAIIELTLERPLIGRGWAWAALGLVAVGGVVAMIPVSLGLASILYTFYPPLIGNPFFYIGSSSWSSGLDLVGLTAINLIAWKREKSRETYSTGNVRQCRRCFPVGLDGGRSGDGDRSVMREAVSSGRRRRQLVLGQQFGYGGRRHRRREEEALHLRAIVEAEQEVLARALDALRRHRNAK